MKSCFAQGKNRLDQENAVRALFCEARVANEKQGGTIKSHIRSNALTTGDTAMIQTPRYIIMNFLTISHIENQEFRHISKHDVVFSRKTLVLIMLVEKRITLELCNTTVALIY